MLREFYAAVLPATGYYALFQVGPNKHAWYDSLDALTRQTEKRLSEQGLYFATASFESPGERKIENALFRRAFCFDIDAGAAKAAKHGDKVYATQRDAIADLFRWCTQRNLAYDYLVSSGDGLHVYFTLRDDVSVAQWRPVALALKALAVHDGLRVDAGVTGDPVRVLRPLGTLHHTGKVVRALQHTGRSYDLSEFASLVDVLPKTQPDAPARRRLNEELLSAPVGPPRSVEKIISRCPAMAFATERGGNVPEPYWRAMLGVIKFTVEGPGAAHKYSSGHPEYDYGDTQAKLDRWTAGPTTCATFANENPQACAGCEYQGRVKSPILLGELTAPEVAAMPPELVAPEPKPEPALFGTSDPEEAEEPARPRTEWEGQLPEGYRVVAAPEGFMMAAKRVMDVENAAGDMVKVEREIPFTNVPFWFESWALGCDDTDQAISIYAAYDHATGKVKRFTMPTRCLAKRDTLLGELAKQNIQAYPPGNMQKTILEDYAKSSMERIRAIGQRQKIVDRFGTMHNSRGELVVAQGKHVIHASGEVTEGVVHEALRFRSNAYCVPVQNDNAGRWPAEDMTNYVLPRAKRHAAYLREFYGDDNFVPYQLAIMLAIASPLLAFSQGTFQPDTPLPPGSGLTVSLYSTRSGIGKTSAMHAAALAFGIPSGIVLQLDKSNSTDNARHHLVLQSGTLPSFMDEMEDVDARDMAALVSSVANGVSKSRMTKGLGIVGGKPMALVNVMSTNKSHRELIAADRNESPAVQMRLLEIDCTDIQEVTPERANAETRARAQVYDCAGAIGAILHWEMCKLGSYNVNALCVKTSEVARTLMSGKQDGRFMWRALGAMLAAHAILHRSGLAVFDQRKLVAEFRKWHDRGYAFAAENIMPTEPTAIMSMFLADIAADTLITRTETHRAGGNEARADIPLNDRVSDNVVARSVLDGRYVYVRADALREWCSLRKISAQALINKCAEAGVFDPQDVTKPFRVTRQVDLFKGTKLAQGIRSRVLKVLVDRLTDYDEPAVPANVVDLKAPSSAPSAPPASVRARGKGT